MKAGTMDSVAIKAAWQHLQQLRVAGTDAIFTATDERRQELVAEQKEALEALEALRDLGLRFVDDQPVSLREAICDQRDALWASYSAGVISLTEFVAEDERLARVTGDEAELLMAPHAERWTAELKKAKEDRFKNSKGALNASWKGSRA